MSYICVLYIYLFFYLLQCQWPRHGSEVLENTLLILRGRAIPPSSVGFASGHLGGYCPTPQDSEGIFQYLLAMPRPLSHFPRFVSSKVYHFPRFVCKIYFTSYNCTLYVYLSFYLLQYQWPRHCPIYHFSGILRTSFPSQLAHK